MCAAERRLVCYDTVLELVHGLVHHARPSSCKIALISAFHTGLTCYQVVIGLRTGLETYYMTFPIHHRCCALEFSHCTHLHGSAHPCTTAAHVLHTACARFARVLHASCMVFAHSDTLRKLCYYFQTTPEKNLLLPPMSIRMAICPYLHLHVRTVNLHILDLHDQRCFHTSLNV